MTTHTVRLARLCSRISDGTHGTFGRVLDGFPLLSAKNIQASGVAWDDSDSLVSESDYGEITRSKSFQPGDVLLTIVGTIGRVSRLRPGDPTAFQRSVASLRPGQVDGDYLYWLMQSQPAQSELQAAARQSAQAGVYLGDVANLLVQSVSERAEQRRIADFLDDQVARTDVAIELRKRELLLLREQRDAFVKSIVSGEGHRGRAPADLPWLDALPEHWSTPKITYAARLGSGHTPSRSRPEWWVDCDIPWITTGEVAALRDDNIEDITETREKLSRLGIENSSAEIHPAGTVVLSRTASAGYSGVMATDMCTSQDFVTWTCTSRLNPYWLLWCLRAMRPDLLGRLAMGSTFKTIYVPDIQTLRIPLPPVAEQDEGVAEIRRAVETAKRRTGLINRGIALLEERKQALITAAVTGHLDVKTARAVA